ncbi:hypothetical protein PPYR_01282 [Photinus pyralis]|uniref:Tetratricopeptide repeat protein 37 n=3 Tax=Photinus pyralis TaxID=7054 RepID=A0A5N4B3Z0_PHOPY|nr:tetratricopeptide repeat protein 37 isoform X1 [Photinus pyralis]KAB0804312.1 hypothetical protein PPYR_01282 [Photinus pyralis]
MSSKEIKSLLKEAREAISKKDFKLSLELCKKILSLDRENYMALVFVGLSLQELGLNDKVIPTFKKAIQISPKNALAFNGLANYLEKLQTDEAQAELISIYVTILNLESDDKKLNEVCEKLGALSISDNHFTDVLEALQKVVSNESVTSATLASASVALANLISKRSNATQSVLDVYEAALKVVLSNEHLITRQYYSEYVKTLYKNKRYSALFKVGKEMFNLYNTDLSSIKWMCQAYTELAIEQNDMCKEQNEIEKYCDILLNLEASSSVGLGTKALFLYENKNFLAAVDLLKQVTYSRPDWSHMWVLLGLCYLDLHMYNNASRTSLTAQQQCNDHSSMALTKQLDKLLPQVLSRSTEDEYLEKGVNFCLDKLKNAANVATIYIPLIRCYINLENFTQANLFLSKLKDMSNEPAMFTLLNAQLLHKQKHHQDALDLLLKEDNNDISEWWYEIGTLYWDLTLFDKSLIPFLKAAKLDPNCYIYFLHLGHYYQKFNDVDKARRCYEKACAMNDKCIEAVVELTKIYRSQKNWDANATLLQNLTGSALNTENKWAWLQLGLNFLEQEDYTNATDTLRCVVRANPNDSYCWESLADAYMARGAYTSALKSYQKATEIQPKSLYPLLQVANIKKKLGDFVEAHCDYESILRSNKHYVPALKGLAETCIMQARQFTRDQRLGIARDYAEKALDMVTVGIRQQNDLCCLWKLAGDSCVLIAKLPDKYCCALALKALAEGCASEENVVLEREELLLLAERCYHKALSMMDVQTMLWYDLASCFVLHAHYSDDKDKAEKYYSKAADILEHCVCTEASCWQFWNLIGVIAFKRDKKDYALAQHALIKAVTADDGSAVAWCNLGTLYLVLEEPKLANEAFSQAQRADPNYVNSWIGQALIAESMVMDDAMDLFRHSTQLGFHVEGAIGYANWVCQTLQNMKPRVELYSIHNMHAIPVACDAMTWYTETFTDDPCGWNMLGLLKGRMGLNSEATLAFRNALRLSRKQTRDKVAINYGHILFKSRNYKEAIKMFNNVEEATFNSGSGLALSLFKDEQYEESYEKYDQALHWLTEEEGHQSDLLVALASIVYMFQGPDPAKTLLFQSTELSPPSSYGFYATLSLGLLHGDPNLANLVLKELHKMRDVPQCLPHYATLVCHTYVLQGQHETAIREVSKLIHRHPNQASLWLTLSILLIRSYSKRSQSIAAAARCAQQAVKLGRGHIDVKKVLCIASLASFIAGDHQQALKSAQKAIHCYPDVAECWAVFIQSVMVLQNKKSTFSHKEWLQKCVRHFKENLESSKLLSTWLDKIIVPKMMNMR